jgi:hypothetical protein
MLKQLAVCLVSVLATLSLSIHHAGAVLVASDDASQAAYNDGWQVGDNGGSGFAAWSTINNQSGSGFGGGFHTTANPASQINVGGEAFGVFGNSNGVGQAIRSFSNAINVSDTISLAMDNGSIDNGGTVGFGLQNSSGNNLFEFFFVGGEATYKVNRLGGSTATSVGFTDVGLQLSFTLTDADSFSFSIDRLTDGVGTNVVNVTGDLIAAGSISRIRLFNANGGADAFFNSFAVTAVPEASAFLCFGAVGVVAGLWRLRARRGRAVVGSAAVPVEASA